jgi:hypothetical protein
MKASRAAEVTTLELQPSIYKMTCQAKGGSLAPSLPTGIYSDQVIQSQEFHLFLQLLQGTALFGQPTSSHNHSRARSGSVASLG